VEDISPEIGEILNECLANGMRPPFIICAASPNGSALILRFTEEEPDVLAEHYEADGFTLPMTIMVLDQNNASARIALESTGRTWY